MTLAGQNRKCDIWRFTYNADSVVGGANPTGTVIYHNVTLRMQEEPYESLLLQQGIEGELTFTANIVPGTLTIQDRDELQVVFPPNDHYYGDKFRVIGHRYADFNPTDPRSYIMLNLRRVETSHVQQ
jgi:hypothetical protein